MTPAALATPVELLVNPGYDPAAPAGDFPVAAVRREIASWPGYAPTPLLALDGIATELGVATIAYKDEGGRFGLGSFKALGGAYAVLRIVQDAVARATGSVPASADLRAGAHADVAGAITVATATDGNHGRSVAWGARQVGAKAVVFIPAGCSPGREAAIAAYGARVIRTAGDYDGAVAGCAEAARANGWIVVADTDAETGPEIPALVTQGYAVMIEEALAQAAEQSRPPTHVFVQAGVGALAAAVCETIAALGIAPRPKVVVVEPDGAACLLESAKAGHAAQAPGPVHSVMAGLECGRASPVAWTVLARHAFALMTVTDAAVAPAMRLLADPPDGDPPIVAGESAVAGLIGLASALADADAARALDLGRASRVLVFGTEGASDPDVYRRMVYGPDGATGSGDDG